MIDTNSKEYVAWRNMKARCDRENHPSYRYYGGKGISYDPRWATFAGFYADMGEAKGHQTLDRRESSGNYDKENCRWATWSEQGTNKSMRLDNKSGVAGVSYDNTFSVWLAHAKRNCRRIQLYRGKDFFQACCARKSWDAQQTFLGV